MSASSVPIPLDLFALAIQDLELEQLHEESARLQNSVHHLGNSNEILKEYPDDQDCKDALQYNIEVIRQQQQRIAILRLELGRRGVRSGHAEEGDHSLINGHASGVHINEQSRQTSNGVSSATLATSVRNDINQSEEPEDPASTEEQGIFL